MQVIQKDFRSEVGGKQYFTSYFILVSGTQVGRVMSLYFLSRLGTVYIINYFGQDGREKGKNFGSRLD